MNQELLDERLIRIDGAKLKKLRVGLSLSQRALADRIGAEKGAVSRWERTSCGMRLELFRRLAELAGVTVTQLRAQIGGTAGTPTPSQKAVRLSAKLQRRLDERAASQRVTPGELLERIVAAALAQQAAGRARGENGRRQVQSPGRN